MQELIVSMKLKRWRNIFFYSSLHEFYNYTGTIIEFVDALLEVIGFEGTLIIPAYSLLRKSLDTG